MPEKRLNSFICQQKLSSVFCLQLHFYNAGKAFLIQKIACIWLGRLVMVVVYFWCVRLLGLVSSNLAQSLQKQDEVDQDCNSAVLLHWKQKGQKKKWLLLNLLPGKISVTLNWTVSFFPVVWAKRSADCISIQKTTFYLCFLSFLSMWFAVNFAI